MWARGQTKFALSIHQPSPSIEGRPKIWGGLQKSHNMSSQLQTSREWLRRILDEDFMPKLDPIDIVVSPKDELDGAPVLPSDLIGVLLPFLPMPHLFKHVVAQYRILIFVFVITIGSAFKLSRPKPKPV